MIDRALLLTLIFSFAAIAVAPPDFAHAVKSAKTKKAAKTLTVKVKVKKTSLRKDKQFFAPTISEAKFGDILEILEKDKDWRLVSFKKKKGWVHQSALALKSGGGSLSLSFDADDDPKDAATSDEVALAGKGFNARVEGEYRKNKKRSNYDAVDRMEKTTVSQKELLRFVKEGGLAKEPIE